MELKWIIIRGLEDRSNSLFDPEQPAVGRAAFLQHPVPLVPGIWDHSMFSQDQERLIGTDMTDTLN